MSQPSAPLDRKPLRAYGGACIEGVVVHQTRAGVSKARVSCDILVFRTVPDDPRHVMLQFTTRNNQSAQVIGFGGYLLGKAPPTVGVSTLYLSAEPPLPSDGRCVFNPSLTTCQVQGYGKGGERTFVTLYFKSSGELP